MATVYEVGTVKQVALDAGASRTYVSVDGGMSDNPRTALYDADYTVVVADRHSDAAPMMARVVGKHCESGDIVVRDAWLPDDVRAEDLLAVAATGAYCRSMASTYNMLGRPPVVAVSSTNDPRVLIRRETVDDLLALDTGALTAAESVDVAACASLWCWTASTPMPWRRSGRPLWATAWSIRPMATASWRPPTVSRPVRC